MYKRCFDMLFICLWLLVVPGHVRGQQPDKDVLPRLVANLPTEAEVVVMVRDPVSVMRANEQNSGLLMGVKMGLLRRTQESWHAFAEKLKLSPTEAVGALGGAGVALVLFSDEQKRGGERWVVLSVVSAQQADELRKQLSAIPRQIVGGQPVLSVEDGRYALILRSVVPMDDRAAQMMIIAPWSDDTSVLEMAARAVGGVGGTAAKSLGSTPAWKESRSVRSDVLVLSRSADAWMDGAVQAEAGEGEPWSRYAILRGDLDARRWRFVYGQWPAQKVEEQRVLPRGFGKIFERMSRDASVALVDHGSRRIGATTPGQILTLGGILGGAAIETGDEPYVMTIVPQPRKSVSRVLLAMRHKDSEAAAKDLQERSMKMMTAIQPGLKINADALLSGLPVGVQHVVPMALEAGMPMMPILGLEVRGAWWGAQQASGPETWAVWALFPGTEETRLTQARAEIDEGLCVSTGADEDRRWLTRAVLRPRMFIDALNPTMGMVLTPMTVCTEVRYDAWLSKDGRMEAEVVVQWAEPIRREK